MSQAQLLLAASRSSQLQTLRALLSDLPDIRVVDDALSLRETFNKAEEMEPDLVLISSDMIAEPEFEALVKLFAAIDTRWVGFSVPGAQRRAQTGAARGRSGLFRLSPDGDRAAALAQIRAVLNLPRHRRARLAEAGNPPALVPRPSSIRQKLVLIGSSTGGVEALMTILSSFPPDCPPTAIVQHTGQGYGESLARLLDRNCAARVILAADGTRLQAGQVILAAGHTAHMELSPDSPPVVRMRKGPPIAGHCPSVDALFRSALSMGKRVIGVLLTGMGTDGADGLLHLRRSGAHTIAQDEASSLVYGMPKAAFNTGAVVSQLHIDKLGPEILRLAQGDAPLRNGAT